MEEQKPRRNAISVFPLERQSTLLQFADNAAGTKARSDDMLEKMKRVHFVMDNSDEPTGPLPPIYSVPYFVVGNHPSESRKEKGFETTNVSYPDWHMITPAYDIDFSGMSGTELTTTLFTPGNQNSLFNRSKRWMREKKVITYCDAADKAAAVIGAVLLLFTAVVTIWSIFIGAKEQYVVPEGSTSPSADLLNSFATNIYVKVAKAILTGVSVMIIGWNVFKRTTVPKRNDIIVHGFDGRNKVTKSIKPVLSKISKTFKSVLPKNSGSAPVAVER